MNIVIIDVNKCFPNHLCLLAKVWGGRGGVDVVDRVVPHDVDVVLASQARGVNVL